MNLYVRHRPQNKWINFIHDVSEFRDFIANYLPGRPLLIGDLSTFNKSMLNMLLKFIEENPQVDCYTSVDLSDSIILSRFISIIKEPIILQSNYSLDEWNLSKKDYSSTVQFLDSLSFESKLRAPLLPQNMMFLTDIM